MAAIASMTVIPAEAGIQSVRILAAAVGPTPLRGPQQKLDLHSLERKLDAAAFRAAENA